MDNLPERDVIDYCINKEGETLCNFLIDTNCCILNGRNHVENGYTYVGTQGSSVVDYCLIPYEALDRVKEFRVHLEKDLFNRSNLLGIIDLSTSHPDHSLLSWEVKIEIRHQASVKQNENQISFVKFSRNYPQGFLNDCASELNICIDKLESGVSNQKDIDGIYKEIVSIVKTEMQDKLEHRKIKISVGTDNKHRRSRKPWWNEELTVLWNNLCEAEKIMLKCKSRNRSHPRSIYTQLRKHFNRECQRAKRLYLRSKQNDLESLVTLNNHSTFWKEIGKIGIGKERRKNISMEVITRDGSVSDEKSVVLDTWRNSFCKLLNAASSTELREINSDSTINRNENDGYLDGEISLNEIQLALRKMKNNKAEGLDEIPAEVWKNENMLHTLHSLFNICFQTARIPEKWKCGIINPTEKSSTNDPRDPTSYRGITITPSIYKLYCNVLNSRLLRWETENFVIHDSQNGFRKGRSTIDQLISLTSIIDTRKLKRQSTFVAFIDFSKAYDSIDRSILFRKLQNLGLTGQMFNVVKSLYDGVKCCVRINGIKTEFFDVGCGLKQGCSLSTLFFNLFVNDLVVRLNSLDIGVDIGGEKVTALLYADDLALVASSEHDLQILLNELNDWCTQNNLTINQKKSNIVHFRPTDERKSEFTFRCGDKILDIVPQYIYLGLLLTEDMCYEKMSKHVCKVANRALGLVIAKSKVFGGFNFETFSKLYDSMVWSVINYGASVWGTRQFTCINSIQLRAARYFMGVGRYTPNAAVQGDCGWKPTVVRQWSTVLNQWQRLKSMDINRINYKVFEWCERNGNQRCKNWNFQINTMLRDADIYWIIPLTPE